MATKASTDKKTATRKDIEIVTEKRTKRNKHGEKWEVDIPVGKNVPVLLIKTAGAFQEHHENELRQALKSVCKRHDRGGKLYFEVGESDDVIDATINECIDFCRGIGITAERSVEFTPFMDRGQW